jgi:type I site-specific restriction-modification system R (restriction) subunit
MAGLIESSVEQAVLEWLESLGWYALHGSIIAPDDQLFGKFSLCHGLLRQSPVQAESRADLRHKLSVKAGDVVFATIQKFFPGEKGDQHPALSERHKCNE